MEPESSTAATTGDVLIFGAAPTTTTTAVPPLDDEDDQEPQSTTPTIVNSKTKTKKKEMNCKDVENLDNSNDDDDEDVDLSTNLMLKRPPWEDKSLKKPVAVVVKEDKQQRFATSSPLRPAIGGEPRSRASSRDSNSSVTFQLLQSQSHHQPHHAPMSGGGGESTSTDRTPSQHTGGGNATTNTATTTIASGESLSNLSVQQQHQPIDSPRRQYHHQHHDMVEISSLPSASQQSGGGNGLGRGLDVEEEEDDEADRQQQQQQGHHHHLRHRGSSSFSKNIRHLDDPTAAFNFAMEHRIFLKASLDLVTELDRHAPELGMMDPIVLKAGNLKKASHVMGGVWKVKYVEIRRGMFSYYENAVSITGSRVVGGGGGGVPKRGELLLRKNIPLEASTCTCRAVKLHQKALNFSPGGAIFELSCSNNTNMKRLWMATSREERQAWMQAINNAMVGGSVTRGDCVADHRGIVRTVSVRSPFRTDLRMYLKQQTSMRTARTASEYLSGLRELLNRSLHVPVKWIAKQVVLSNNDGSTNHNTSTMPCAFQEKDVDLSIDQLWRDLQRDSVQINGDIFQGDNYHGPERILAALTRRLLSVGLMSDTTVARSDLRESQALVYARDLLLAGNRTRSGGDSYYCVNTLCGNTDLVVVVPSGTAVEPVKIDISEDESDESFHTRLNEKSGWVRTKSKLQRSWRKHFLVLSDGTLSSYDGATPRPHGLRGQRVLTDASVSVTKRKAEKHEKRSNHDEFILSISLKDGTTKDRLLLFDSEDVLVDWVFALECVTKAKPSAESARKNVRRRSNGPGPEDMFLACSMAEVLIAAQKSTLEHAVKLGLDLDRVTARLANLNTQTTSSLSVSISACTEYKVCTTDPQGDDDQDTWALIRAHFLQAFTITGGPSGRMKRGEEIVCLSVVECLEPTPQHSTNVEATLSPSSMRARINRRIFRNPSVGDDGEGDAPVVVSD